MRNPYPYTHIVMSVPDLSEEACWSLAVRATTLAKRYAPKLTIASSSAFRPMAGPRWIGIEWGQHPYVYFQEVGIKAFTMRSLAGKTIPMWINDPQGEEIRKNPKAQTRITADGRKQVLIFRRAARQGQRTWRRVNGLLVNVPASYPGAPGRIAVNRAQGLIRQRDVSPGVGNPGWIARGNTGVRWRHPGLNPRSFLVRGLHEAVQAVGLPTGTIQFRNELDVALPDYGTAVY